MTAIGSLSLYLTESCNLACSYCFAANMQQRPIDAGLARDAMDLLLFREDNPAREVSVTFWGGEPLLAFDRMVELVSYGEQRAKQTERTIRFSFPTNLTLLTESMLDFLIEHEVGMSLSLDGDERAQSLRPLRGGKSSFPVVVRKLELLCNRMGKRLPGVRMTVSPATASDLGHNVQFFLDRGFRTVYFSAVAEAEWSKEQLLAYENEQRVLAGRWSEALRNGRPWFSTSWNKSLAQRELRRGGARKDTRGVPCGAGERMLAVDIYGDIFPCHRFVFYDKAERAHAMGNVRDLAAPGATIPQLSFDPNVLSIAAEDPALPFHPNVRKQVCPALNCAMCGNLHQVHPRLAALQSMEERVLDELESSLRNKPVYQKFVDEVLLPNYRWGELSATTVMMLTRVTNSNADDLANQAEAVLRRLQEQRRGEPA